MKDYYKILHVKSKDNQHTIRTAYISLAKKYHPDVNQSPYAKRNFQEIVEAYQVLKNKKLKEEYDFLINNLDDKDRLKTFLSKVASIEKLAEIITAMQFYKKLNRELTGTGATAGISAGAYWGARAGGIPGALIGGVIGGIVGAVGGKAIGKTVEKMEEYPRRQQLNQKIINFIEKQPEVFQKGIAEIIITNFEHPNIKYEESRLKTLFFGHKKVNSYIEDKDVVLTKAATHIKQMIRNDASFELVSEYICYLKKYSAKNDLKEFLYSVSHYNNSILIENNVEKQKELNKKIKQVEEKISDTRSSISSGNSDFRNFLYIATTIVSIITYIIIVSNSSINPWIVLMFFTPFTIFIYRKIYKFSKKRLQSLEKKLADLEKNLKGLEDELRNTQNTI